MKPNRWIDASRRLYARLLKLYPQEHRNEYGPAMQQVFHDQCRAAYVKSGFWGLLLLWPRILLDLATSSLREHLAAPNLAVGLLEAPPNRPLPWKGVALVIIPGLVFLICQIGQLTGKDWFFWATRRSGFLFIIPVLVVWAIKRKFPIWGLIPVGVLYSAFLGFGYRLQIGLLDRTSWLKYARMYRQHEGTVIATIVVGFLVGIIILLWLISHRQKISPMAWGWLGIYLVLGLAHRLPDFFIFLDELASFDTEDTVWYAKYYLRYTDFYFRAAFLVLVLLAGCRRDTNYHNING